jgi:thioredoxin 1
MLISAMTFGSILTLAISGTLIVMLVYLFLRAKKQLNKPPSVNVKILTDANFESTVGSGVSLVDFWAAWCGPCKVQGPIVDEVADELVGKASICKLNIDENVIAAQKYGIQSIPTILIFKNGKPVKKFVGVRSKAALISAIEELL